MCLLEKCSNKKGNQVSEMIRRGEWMDGSFFSYVFALGKYSTEEMTDEQAKELYDALDDATDRVLERFTAKHGEFF